MQQQRITTQPMAACFDKLRPWVACDNQISLHPWHKPLGGVCACMPCLLLCLQDPSCWWHGAAQHGLHSSTCPFPYQAPQPPASICLLQTLGCCYQAGHHPGSRQKRQAQQRQQAAGRQGHTAKQMCVCWGQGTRQHSHPYFAPAQWQRGLQRKATQQQARRMRRWQMQVWLQSCIHTF